jgi:predicted transcriptional regulator
MKKTAKSLNLHFSQAAGRCGAGTCLPRRDNSSRRLAAALTQCLSKASAGVPTQQAGVPAPRHCARILVRNAGIVEAFFERSLDRARKLDRGGSFLLTFEDPDDLLRLLTAQRVRVLRAVRKRPAPVSDLAVVLKRDRTAVKRNVKILASLGLVKIHEETDPGHLALKYELVATI